MRKRRETRALEMSVYQNFVKVLKEVFVNIFLYSCFNNLVHGFIARLQFKNFFPRKHSSHFRVNFNTKTLKLILKTPEDTRRVFNMKLIGVAWVSALLT